MKPAINGNPVSAGEDEYPSQKAAAEAIGVSPRTICRHLNRYGNLDRLLVGKRSSRYKPATRGSVTYVSYRDAAQALGIAASTVAKHMRKHGHLNRVGIKPGRQKGQHVPGVPVKVGPLEFKSISEASRTLGIPLTTMGKYAHGTASHKTVQRVISSAMKIVVAQDSKTRT